MVSFVTLYPPRQRHFLSYDAVDLCAANKTDLVQTELMRCHLAVFLTGCVCLIRINVADGCNWSKKL